MPPFTAGAAASGPGAGERRPAPANALSAGERGETPALPPAARTPGARRWSPSLVNTDEPEQALYAAGRRVLEIQAKLHRWAVDDPHHRFGDLFNLVTDPAFLLVAWDRVPGQQGRGVKLRHPSLMFNQLAPIQAQGGPQTAESSKIV